MAVTRIKNNQITDASGSNTQLGVNAAVKLQNYTVTAGKLANSLVYGSDLTVSGNLTVNGTTTTVDTINTLIKDPILVLADGQTAGTPTVDIGILGYRGSSNSSFLGWQETGNTFMAILSNTTVSNTTVNVSSYANFTASTITAQGNLSVIGNIIGSANFTGNVTAGNLLTPGIMSSTGNAIHGNILTGGLVSATGNITTAANINLTGDIFDTGALQINTAASGAISLAPNGSNTLVASTTGVAITGTASATGNVTGGNVLTGGLISATSTITSAATITGGNLATGGTASATGNITGGNVLTGGLISATSTITSAATITGGNLATGGTASATGNITGGNILTGGLVSATGNATAGNILTGGLISAAGNITSATNVNTPNVVATANLTLRTSGSGNILLSPTTGNIVVGGTYINGVTNPVQDQDAATKIYVDNAVSTQLSYHQAVTAATVANLATTTGGTITYAQPNGAANGVGATITTTGSFNLIDTANVQTANTRIMVKNEGNAVLNGVYVWSNATVITRSTDADTYGANSITDLSINDYFFVTSGNVNKGSAYIVDAPSGTITFGTSNISFAQFSSSQTYTSGNGININGTVINTIYDNSTIGVNGSNQLYIPANAPLVTPNIGAATGTSLSVTGAVTAGTNLSAVANVVAGNVSTVGLITATGNVTGGNVLTAGIMSSTGNGTHGNVLTGGLISATATITGGNLATGGTASATGNITGGNVLTGGLISATSTITSSANITGGNVLTGGLVSATGNATAGNILTGGLISATATITGGNLATGGTASATGNITGGNVLTGGLVSATGNGTFGNIVLTGNSIQMLNAGGTITMNDVQANTNFAVDGLAANVFFVNATSNTASFGNNAQTVNAIVSFNTTNSIKLPVGITSERPATGVTGMLRFNTTNNGVEVYNNSAWQAVGATTFTVIADDQFNGDGSNVAFTLTSTQTTNSCIVSINGVVQIPTSAYSVSGTTLTFTEAPAAGDLIDVREITTTTTVTAISNNSGNATVTGNTSAAQIDVLGNLVPTGNNTQFLGSATNYWNTVYAKATSAQYADLAEKYVADAEYAPGTVVSFGGEKEVTQSSKDSDRAVAGVISTNPSYIMNATLEAEHVATVAFTGRVPTSVTGIVAKGDLMVSNGDGTARAEADPKAGAIIGKALENFAGDTGTIEVVIGRF